MGVDSMAMCIVLWLAGIRPTAVLHADTGSEWPETVAYRHVVRDWLAQVGWPELTIVKNPSPRAGHRSLEHNCIDNRTLPSIAYGFQRHSCSLKWKVDPMNRWISQQEWAQDAWFANMTVVRCIGYDASPADQRRTFKAYNRMGSSPLWTDLYPLQESNVTRAAGERLIAETGLPVPRKSACFFCPASKHSEIIDLAVRHPQLAARALYMEALASHNYRTISGLGGSSNWRNILSESVPELLEQLDAQYETGKHLPEAYASGEEVWIPKRKRGKNQGQQILFAAA